MIFNKCYFGNFLFCMLIFGKKIDLVLLKCIFQYVISPLKSHKKVFIFLQVLKSITSGDNKLQEVMLGLATQVFKFMSSEEAHVALTDSGIKKQELANSLVAILKKHDKPAIKVPRIRRFVIELAIWMMEDDVENVVMFRDLGMERELEKVLETTAELENFDVFSGTVGVSRHSRTVHWLAELAVTLLKEDQP